MTRINLVPPSELMDQHLLAEWREIKMIPASLRRSLKTKNICDVQKSIPSNYCLGTGHVRFFFDKLIYLTERYEQLTHELIRRKFSLYHTGSFNDFCHSIPDEFFGNYIPTDEALCTIRARIDEKIAMKPKWYRKTFVKSNS